MAKSKHTDVPDRRESTRDAPRIEASVHSGEWAAGISSPSLRRAAMRVFAAHTGAPSQATLIRPVLLALTTYLDRRFHGEDVLLDPSVDSPVGRRLLEHLRVEFGCALAETSPAPAFDEVLHAWNVFEETRAAVGHGERHAGELDWSGEFAAQLSAPNGLDLVVEIAHDLRSPLTSILFLAETLQRGQSGPVNDLQHRQLGLVYSAALGLSTLASNVMELARGGSRLADDRGTPFSVGEVLESIADIVRPMAEEKGLGIRVFPPAPDHRLGPAQAVSRVLLNLTTNAIKFTEGGFVEVVGKSLDDRTIEFSVRDTGRGINPKSLNTLFMPFRPGPGDDRLAFSGTGLGLALCRRLVAAMGSELRFETSPDWGTRFHFELDLPPTET
jgi:signal transduction histidine kinase